MKKERNDVRFVTLERFTNYWTAEVVKNMLLGEGIHAHILDSHANYSIGPTLLDGYRLQVEQSQFLKALNLYKNTLEDQ